VNKSVKYKYLQRTITLLSGVGGMLMLCSAPVAAQMDPGSGSPPKQNPAATDTRPRTRAADEKSTGVVEVSSPKQAPESTEAPQPKQPKSAPESQPDLKTQIEAATTPQEKAVLRLKYVEQLVTANKKPEALDELHSLAAEDRFDPQSFYNIGNALARLDDLEGAINSYRKAIEQKNGHYGRALNNLGVVLLRLGRWQEANEALTSAVRVENFHYAEASYNLGRLYAAQGQMDLALREWHRALKVDPRHKAAAQAIARASGDDRIVVASDPKMGRVQSSSDAPDSQSSFKNSNAAVTAKAFSPSRTKPLTVDPVTYNQLQRARSAHERGRDQEAIASYRDVISRMGGYFGPANLELSYILIGMKQPGEALSYLQDVTARDGARYPISYYHLARIYEFNGDLAHAGEAYAQAAAHFQGINPQFLLDVSRVSEKRGDYKQALAAMEQYVTAFEGHGARPAWSEERLAALREKAKQ
jgi:tetratricopeptide (TPR) repeat protein